MKRSRSPLNLKCLTIAVAVALVVAPTVQAAAATSRPTELGSMAVSQHVQPEQVQPNDSGKSYLWSDVAITAGVLAGIVALGLWGDVAIGGLIFGVELLCAGAAFAARKVRAHGREASRPVGQVAESKPAASSR